MGYIKVSGIVIKEVNTGDADKIVTLFTKNHGKVQAFAKGARRPKSPLAACTQIFCYSDFILFKGKEMYNISSGDIVETFYNVRNDIETLTYCAHITEIVGDVVQEEQPSSRLLQLYLNTLHVMSKGGKSPVLLVRTFELRMLAILGYTPYVKACSDCGNIEDIVAFSYSKCGLICKNCLSLEKDLIMLSQGAVRALHHIIYAPIKILFSFEVSDSVLNELSRLSTRYLSDRLDKKYKKLDFLNLLNFNDLQK